MTTAELLLHPIRLRIVQALLGERMLTTADLRAELPDVPPATLYRQIAALVEGEVLEVAAERKVRGAFERTYRLRMANAHIGPEDAAGLSAEEHRQAFMTFVASLLADFDRYLARDDVDLGRDGVGYRQVAMYLNDEEFQDFLKDLRAVLTARLGNQPAPGRTRRILSTIVMPS
ncbi:transcriptional regulator [Microbispora rosea subsp. aerata]|nr:helix-turn-helix domain-containing protein [Microbispora rosea]GGO12985.1 transcriptional regulator [Microbispora rosea subsp. aerata]GIH54177.1 transcriptional regulator [Microbispora rosea subsp. aerata]GLJ85151.1 transcriptional regulator [Microbispora rosea subsp. aerata]